jgi:hypothetical protein
MLEQNAILNTEDAGSDPVDRGTKAAEAALYVMLQVIRDESP